ncbi:sugar-binding domain-containing protein [Pararcticibacter amylolyticus]|uniref:Beta-glucuronidase n=1 Tax=Pararcticibacter amylolyticus TaxID=2173175 RepID=A0A2U2PHS2_9SPHI|nr:sugar-binding domain-containing protein [Pararcticibacter amylolyticus]PWG80941.1 beta-glucuronidase [Pararcticibacter amylolyticus]
MNHTIKRYLKSFFIILLFIQINPLKAQTIEVDLSGTWGFQTDLMDFRRGSLSPRYNHLLQGKIELPGITDDYQIGYKSPYRYIDRLTRKYEYMGPAWYQRDIEIPASWKGKRIFMYFERTHWLSSIYVDTKEVSKIDYISVPHNHDLTDFVKPGKSHRITVCIDNRFQYNTHKWNHAHTEFTQINWNGILGKMKLIAVDPVYIDDIQVYPNIADKSVKVRLQINNDTKKAINGGAVFKISGTNYSLSKEVQVVCKDSVTFIESIIQLGKNIKLWDEFNPNLYTISCQLKTSDDKVNYQHEKSATFGMREVKQGKNHVLINNRPVHLRGNVENAVFPKTGHAPVDDASWERIMLLMKEYGMNHLRFHSWCPPEAAFRMADKHGIYFEVEMPMWGKDAEPDEARYNFFRREIKAILKEYGNHPSFVLYCNGNEITGNFDFIEELTAEGRKLDPRHLYSGSTARTRVKSDQYYVSQQTNKGPVKVYEGLPETDWDRNTESDVDVPVISHESGQRCIYPNFEEIKKYANSPVEARNFEVFKEMLEKNGMGDQAHDFFRASGALTVLEYKAVIEALLRSSKSAGFQLLSINDFPGQGYAPVGILDPFWDSKGLVTPEKFREFCAPRVALLRYDKSAYFNDETFKGKAEVYNFSNSEIKNAKLKWWLTDDAGKVLKKGNLKTQTIANDNVSPIGEFSIALNGITVAQKLAVHLSVNDQVKNSWNIWVYPKNKSLMQSTDQVLYTTVYDDAAQKQLAAGKTVVLCPMPNNVKGRKSIFHNHFWNPIMFAWPPMTIGCLIHQEEPVFKDFTTSYHTDWQWWDILNNAKVIEMQDTPGQLRPFIQVIDSYDNNQKLGIGFEAKVKGGKLLVLAVDTQKDMDKRPATQQLLRSIDNYVKSDKFAPKVAVEESFIQSFLIK